MGNCVSSKDQSKAGDKDGKKPPKKEQTETLETKTVTSKNEKETASKSAAPVKTNETGAAPSAKDESTK